MRPVSERRAERIGWIGTGVMGAAMCGHLLDAGYEVDVHNRTRERAEPLLERGARWRDSPAAAAAEADALFTIVGYPADVRSVVLGEDGALASLRPGSLLIEMTTSEPSLAEEIHAAGAGRGVEVLDAPVSGGDVGARAGTLSVMVGGSEEGFRRAQQLLEPFSRRVTLQGGPGAGQHTKMANQISIVSGMVGMCEALLYAYRAGLDLEGALATINAGAGASWSLENYGPRLLAGDTEPGFKVDHFVKDLGIALDEAERMNLELPGLELAAGLYRAAQEQGLGEQGTQSLLLVLARLNEVEWSPGGGSA